MKNRSFSSFTAVSLDGKNGQKNTDKTRKNTTHVELRKKYTYE